MQTPMNIAQFNALLHSKNDQTQLISALDALTTVNDLDLFVKALRPQAQWGGW